MHVSEAIAELGRERTIQRRAQGEMFASLAAWRSQDDIAPVLSDIAKYGQGVALQDCPDLSALMQNHEAALRFAGSFTSACAAAMRRAPFAQVALRHNCSDNLSVLQLAGAGRARLFLMSREPLSLSATQASFTDMERHEIVLAGRASGRVVVKAREGLDCSGLTLEPAVTLSTDCYRQSVMLERIETRITSLRLEREAENPRPTCLHELATGRVLHRAQGCKQTSRREMMVALLGRMQAEAAQPVFAEIALGDRPRDLRWHALRELLAVDTQAGFGALTRIAARPGDPLADHAASLRQQLMLAHPQLGLLEDDTCPA